MTQKPLLRVESTSGVHKQDKHYKFSARRGVQNQHTAKKAQRRQGPSASSRAIHTSFRRPFSCLQALDQNAQVPPPYKACPGRVSLLPPYQESFLLPSSTTRMLVTNVASTLSCPRQRAPSPEERELIFDVYPAECGDGAWSVKMEGGCLWRMLSAMAFYRISTMPIRRDYT